MMTQRDTIKAASNIAGLWWRRKRHKLKGGEGSMSADDGFLWYYSHDRERWRAAASRDDAIARGREQYDGTEFHICEASSLPLNDNIFSAFNVIDDFECRNEDVLDPETPPLADSFSTEARYELEAALNAAWAEWRARHGTWKPFAFDVVRNEETIPSTE